MGLLGRLSGGYLGDVNEVGRHAYCGWHHSLTRIRDYKSGEGSWVAACLLHSALLVWEYSVINQYTPGTTLASHGSPLAILGNWTTSETTKTMYMPIVKTHKCDSLLRSSKPMLRCALSFLWVPIISLYSHHFLINFKETHEMFLLQQSHESWLHQSKSLWKEPLRKQHGAVSLAFALLTLTASSASHTDGFYMIGKCWKTPRNGTLDCSSVKGWEWPEGRDLKGIPQAIF